MERSETLILGTLGISRSKAPLKLFFYVIESEMLILG